MECGEGSEIVPNTRSISTHALTWSAAWRIQALECCNIHFNSRTHVECGIATAPPGAPKRDFNSRTHVECGLGLYYHSPSFLSFQLTHSRGVRRLSAGKSALHRKFQLTHSRGVRPYASTAANLLCTFQLTHSRGVRRPEFLDSYTQQYDFNSRTHVECGASVIFFELSIYLFQLTHSRGVRLERRYYTIYGT